ncbi:MAG: PDZ domain-containing protein [Arhodomonas sp.]|nr:PDZ domain-containing protein [Arhodomonas sp.]
MKQLIKYGEVRRGLLGVRVQDLTPEIAEAMGMDERRGALIAQVQPGSAAEDAGLQEGDVVTAVERRGHRRAPPSSRRSSGCARSATRWS